MHDPDTFYLSAMTIFETEIGIRRLERRDPFQGRILREWLSGAILPRYAGRILPVDDRVAVAAARFHIPDPAPVNDSLIAATALIHGLTVVTRNTGDFRFAGIVTLNPWDHPLPPEALSP